MASTILLTILFIGLAYPLNLLVSALPKRNGDYQKSVIFLTNELLKDQTDYIAGIELVYNKNEPIPGLRHLGLPAINFLKNPTEKLKSAMLTSLDYTPNANISSIIESLRASQVKFYVNNYRINDLPIEIKHFLASDYTHLWGSIYLYAPLISAPTTTVKIKFAGKYFVESLTTITIDNQQISPSSIVQLTKGNHTLDFKKEFRLKLIPTNVDFIFNPKNQKDTWEKMT